MKNFLNKKICKYICAALSLTMLCGVPFTGAAYSAAADPDTPQTNELRLTSLETLDSTVGSVEVDNIATLNKLGKIDDQLCDVLKKAGDDELIPVSIWITDIDFEEVEKKVEAEIGLSRNILEQKSDALRADFATQVAARLYSADAVTAMSDSDFIAAFKDYKELNKAQVERFDEDVQSYTNEQRNTAKDMLVKSNADFVDRFLGDAEDVRAYEYFPIIDCSITKERILFLASLNGVESISSNADKDDAIINFSESETSTGYASLITATQVANAISVNLESVNGDYTRDSLGFDGGGIKIGQIEHGVPKKTAEQLKNATINVHGSTNVDEHATLVASILVGKDGMAPGATLSSFSVATKDEIRDSVQKLINEGINIINMSAGVSSTDKVLRNLADYVVFNYNITWVCAAGNYNYSHPTYDVTSPATAYNVITVGATDAKNDLYPSNDIIASYSCYLTSGSLSDKPEVVAPGSKYCYVGDTEYVEGTSFAAPIIAGLAAQMMSFSSDLKLKPETIKAAIIASCDHKTPDITGSSHINAKEGAGVINALNAANSLSLMKLQNTYYNTSDTLIEHTLYPLTNGKKSVAISWLKKATGSLSSYTAINGDISLVDFDLYVTNSNAGSYSSISSRNGYEYVIFTASKTDAYDVTIEKYGSSGTTERIALAINR